MGLSFTEPTDRVCLCKILNRQVREPYAWWCERSTSQLMASLLLDYMMLKLKQSELCDQFFGYADVFIFCLLQDNIAVGFILLNNL